MKFLLFVALYALSGVEAQVRWAAASHGQVPMGAWVAGHQNGQRLFLCRANVNGDFVAGKLDTGAGGCYVPWGGGEQGRIFYDVAVGEFFSWVGMSTSSELPRRVVFVGNTADGTPTYACRTWHDIHHLPGKVHNKFCFVSYANREFRYEHYNILVNDF